jgi:hypothetical protein
MSTPDLSHFDEDFANAPVEEREFDDPPDGKYQVNVEKAELTETKSSSKPMLKWTLKILAPKCVGRMLWRNNVLSSRENVKWLKADLHTCGLELEKLSDLEANLPRLLDVKLEITKRTKGENVNIYFNKRIVVEDSPADGSDDIPF